MKSFIEFLLERKAYRGHDKDVPVDGNYKNGKSPFIWLSYDINTAIGYSKLHTNGIVSKFEVSDKINVIDFGRSEQKMNIKSVMQTIISNSKIKMSDVKVKAFKLKTDLELKFGTNSYTLDKFWYEDKNFSEFIKLFGFDGIHTTEDSKLTVGILQEQFKKYAKHID